MLNRKLYSQSVEALLNKVQRIHQSINTAKEVEELDGLDVPSVVYYLNSIEPVEANAKFQVNFSLVIIHDDVMELADACTLIISKLHEEYLNTLGFTGFITINQGTRYPLNQRNESIKAMLIDGYYTLNPVEEEGNN